MGLDILTENGGLWKIGLSNEQANAEVRLAQVKQQQQKILEREQAIVDNLKEIIELLKI